LEGGKKLLSTLLRSAVKTTAVLLALMWLVSGFIGEVSASTHCCNMESLACRLKMQHKPGEDLTSLEQVKMEKEKYLPDYVNELNNYGFCDSQLARNNPVEKLETYTYEVQKGDALEDLAREHDTDVTTLALLNQIDNPHLLIAGEEIKIVNSSGIIHRVNHEEEKDWEEIASSYQVSRDNIKRLENNSSQGPQEDEALLIEAENHQEQEELRELSRSLGKNTTPSFMWPLEGTITSPYGERSGGFHYGLDIAADSGTPIVASAAGEVTYASYMGNYGLLVEIDHGKGWETRYGHNREVTVSEGDKVEAGEIISKTGATGNATGPHLHFEIWKEGNREDPEKYLP